MDENQVDEIGIVDHGNVNEKKWPDSRPGTKKNRGDQKIKLLTVAPS